MPITLIVGPMFAGKTTHLIKNYNHLSDDEKTKAIFVKYSGDNRYSSDDVVITHDNLSAKCKTISGDCISKIYDILRDHDYIFIDEIQFFQNVEILEELANESLHQSSPKHIYLSGLNGTYCKTAFANMNLLYPIADNIIHVRGMCNHCSNEKSSYSFKKVSKPGDGIVDIGGADKYLAVCRKCFIQLSKD